MEMDKLVAIGSDDVDVYMCDKCLLVAIDKIPVILPIKEYAMCCGCCKRTSEFTKVLLEDDFNCAYYCNKCYDGIVTDTMLEERNNDYEKKKFIKESEECFKKLRKDKK